MTPPRHPNKRGRRSEDAPRTGGEEDTNPTPSPPISAIRAFLGFTDGHIALLQHAAQCFGQGLHHLLAQGVFCPTRGAILWYVVSGEGETEVDLARGALQRVEDKSTRRIDIMHLCMVQPPPLFFLRLYQHIRGEEGFCFSCV
jgi:hypothetical protein